MSDEEILERLTALHVPVSARRVRRDEAEAFLAMYREMRRIEVERYNAYWRMFDDKYPFKRY